MSFVSSPADTTRGRGRTRRSGRDSARSKNARDGAPHRSRATETPRRRCYAETCAPAILSAGAASPLAIAIAPGSERSSSRLPPAPRRRAPRASRFSSAARRSARSRSAVYRTGGRLDDRQHGPPRRAARHRRPPPAGALYAGLASRSNSRSTAPSKASRRTFTPSSTARQRPATSRCRPDLTETRHDRSERRADHAKQLLCVV